MGFDGKATLTMAGPQDYQGHKTFLIVFKAEGLNYWDTEHIYLDPETLRPLFVQRDFSLVVFGEGQTLEEYLPGQIIITKTDKGRVSKETISKAGPVDNIYGFIYRYRKQGSFKIGDEMDMSLPTKDLKIKLMGFNRLRIGRKTYHAFYMQSQPTKYKIWFDNSEQKLPLKIVGTIGLMSSVMTMTDYEE